MKDLEKFDEDATYHKKRADPEMRQRISTNDCLRIISDEYLTTRHVGKVCMTCFRRSELIISHPVRPLDTCCDDCVRKKNRARCSEPFYNLAGFLEQGNQYCTRLTTTILTWDQSFHLEPGEIFVLGIVSKYAVKFWRTGGMIVGRGTTGFVLGVLRMSRLVRPFRNLLRPSKSRLLTTYPRRPPTGPTQYGHEAVCVCCNTALWLARRSILSIGYLLLSPRGVRGRGASAWGVTTEVGQGRIYEGATYGIDIRRQ
jgi:hypothetical protein